jgi:DNA-binding NtrC family response regulator
MSSAASPYILLVEPNDLARGLIEAAASRLGEVESFGQFEPARARLRLGGFDYLVTNIRLGAYNGLHLAYLLSAAGATPRAIVYSDERDVGLAREAQRAGAFYEVGACLPVTLAAYFSGTLPRRDRRDATLTDRRTAFRGGRRCWDVHLTQQRTHAH